MSRLTPLFFILALLLGLTSMSMAVELLPYKASYTANTQKGISIKGKAVRELKQSSDGQWLYRFDVKSFVADIDESSRISWQDGRVIPHTYDYKLSAFLVKDKVKKIAFDWDNMTATNSAKRKGWLIEDIPTGTLDRLSYQLQLAMDLQAGKQEMVYQVAHKGKIRANHFKVIGEETVDTALGTLPTIMVEKVREKGKKRKTILWLSKQYPLLLLRMEQVEKNGDRYEINITKASIAGETVTFN